MKGTNKYFFNGDELFVVKNYDKTTYKLIKLNVINKKLVELDDEICKILITYDFNNIPKDNKLLINKEKIKSLYPIYAMGFISGIEIYSFMFSYLFFLNKELQILEEIKYIKNISLYDNIKYDDEQMFNKILNLINI